MDFGIGTYGLGFLAGVLSTLSPCVLPLIPILIATAIGAHRLGPYALAVGLMVSFTAVGIFVASVGASLGLDQEVFRTIAAHIPMLFHSAVGPTSPDVEKGKTLADILPKSTISPRIASDILAKIVGTRVVVVLDEFDRSSSEEFRQNVAELIKNLSDRLVRVQLVIAGVAGNLTELLEHIPSIQRNVGLSSTLHSRKMRPGSSITYSMWPDAAC